MGNLWIGNYEGKLWRYNRKNRKFLPLASKLGFQYKKDSLVDIHEVIFKIYKGKKDVVWIGTSAGLFRLNTNSEKFVDIISPVFERSFQRL
jgi:ligand-binding sensor domain-containing protein